MQRSFAIKIMEEHYYKINAFLMSFVGLWPYQSNFARCTIITFIVCFSIGQIGPQVVAAIKYRDDTSILVEATTIVIVDCVCYTKLFSCTYNSKIRLKLLERIDEHWQKWKCEREVVVLHEYAELGRKMALFYAVALYAMIVFILAISILPKIIDTLIYNGTEPGAFPFPVYYYGFDEQKYFYYLYGYMYVCTTLMMGISIAADTMLIVYVQHACAIFAAVGRKIRQIGELNESKDEMREEFANVSKCINFHQDAIEFANLMEAAYSGYFFFVVGFNMLIISVTGLQLLKCTDDLREVTKWAVFVSGELAHLFVESYISQILTDHSMGVRDSILNAKWYNINLRSQKLFNVMTMRCNTPSHLTAGKIWVMSIETFGLVLKTSMSYFTVLRSAQ